MTLPEEFKIRMREMLKEEYDEFADVWENAPIYGGIRVSTLKTDALRRVESVTGKLKKVPWCKNGYYIDKKLLSGKHPYHMCGLVYFQEPSAMAVAEAIGIKPGDFVLDLCAAPGGKATHAAEKLCGEGVLVANEIIPKRAKLLSENIERMGIRNAVVTNEQPERLAEKYPGFFDKIIVDAPCSGEGMFKKEPRAAEEWSVEHTHSCAERQKKILASAMKMLKPGGRLIYSTCTFAPCENEGVCEWLLTEYPDTELVPIDLPNLTDARGEWVGAKHDLSGAKRIFPHKADGEGHFLALFQKNGGEANSCEKSYKSVNEAEFRKFADDCLKIKLDGEFADFGEKLYLLLHKIDLDKIKTERAGLFLGTAKKGRFEPSHALCLALRAEDFKNTYETAEPEKFYRGETSACGGNGWTAVLYDGCPIGWGKANGGILKNHYPKYLRF